MADINSRLLIVPSHCGKKMSYKSGTISSNNGSSKGSFSFRCRNKTCHEGIIKTVTSDIDSLRRLQKKLQHIRRERRVDTKKIHGIMHERRRE